MGLSRLLIKLTGLTKEINPIFLLITTLLAPISAALVIVFQLSSTIFSVKAAYNTNDYFVTVHETLPVFVKNFVFTLTSTMVNFF